MSNPTSPTASEFVVAFPEFTGAPTGLITAKIADAAGRTDAAVWGALWRQGVMYRTADLLAKSPFGRDMKLSQDGAPTVYEADLKTMIRRVAVGFRVT